MIELVQGCGMRAAQRGQGEIGIHGLAVFESLGVEGDEDGGGVVGGGVYGNNDCLSDSQHRNHDVHDVVYWDCLITSGAVEETFYDT